MRAAEKAYSYAHMKRDEDNTDPAGAELFGKASMGLTALTSMTSFLDPEILASDPAVVMSYIDQEEGLEMYRFMLTELLRQRRHTLSKEEEYVLASCGDVLRSSGNIFTALNNADLDFGTVTDEAGRVYPLTHSSYIKYLESPSKHLRRQAYDGLYKQYIAHANTLCAVYSSSIRKDIITARLRHFGSSLESALA
jgi:oligoendopeptidase F